MSLSFGSALRSCFLNMLNRRHYTVFWPGVFRQTFVEKQTKAFGDDHGNKLQVDSKDKAATRFLSHCFISDQLLEIKETIYS